METERWRGIGEAEERKKRKRLRSLPIGVKQRLSRGQRFVKGKDTWQETEVGWEKTG